ncbi:MAG: peptidoglycan-binding protein, partial [Verrucomicrobiae bacterium]
MMHSFFTHWIRPGALILSGVLLAGCVVDAGPYPRTQSLESAVQTVLAKQGYYQGSIDGTIGPATSRAIRNYQRDHRLTPTGTINPVLAASMGLNGQENVSYLPTLYYPSYAYPAYYAQPALYGVGWGGWWPAAGYG